MIKKLRIKFVVIIMTIVMIMLSTIFSIILFAAHWNLEERTMTMLREIASEPFRIERSIRNRSGFSLPYFILEVNSEGKLLSATGGFYDLSDQEYLQELADEALSQDKNGGILVNRSLRFYSTTNVLHNTVIAFCDTTSETNVLSAMVRSLAIVGVVSFLVFLAISIVFSHWAVKPVEKAWKDQRQFVADASHELKTPLTVIMTNAELLQSADNDPESQKQFTNSILVMSRQMRKLLEKMLELARADNQEELMGLTEVDMSNLAEESELSFEGVFFEKGLSLTTSVQPGIRVRGNADSLQQVIDILLDNAQKYSAPGGETVLSLSVVRGKCHLTVSDPGDPISHEDLKNIFGRFYRVDDARSRDGSFGLGLPIASKIVQLHHGKIWAESSNGINAFHVELPMV